MLILVVSVCHSEAAGVQRGGLETPGGGSRRGGGEARRAGTRPQPPGRAAAAGHAHLETRYLLLVR